MVIRALIITIGISLVALMGFQPLPIPEATRLPTMINPYLNQKELPDLSGVGNITIKKELFFNFLLPIVIAENNHLLQIRDAIHLISNHFQENGSLEPDQQLWLKNIAQKFKLKKCASYSDLCKSTLLKHIDIVPPSLVLAQAANESAWGTSRFATMGNNIFGQWCFFKGCGLVPAQRSGSENHEVKSFESVHHSIRSYMMNLNTHRSYNKLRLIREAKRQKSESITGVDLAQGLTSYSERGQAYVVEITNMILYNNIQRYDYEATGSREL